MPTKTQPDSVSAPDHAPPARNLRGPALLIGLIILGLGVSLAMLVGLPACNRMPNGQADNPYTDPATRRDKVSVYFSKTQGSKSIVEDVSRPLPSGGAENTPEPLKFAVAELLEGPTAEEKTQGFYSEIPQGTKLLDLKYDEKNVTVNLSKQFEEGGGSTTMQQRLEELKRTVYATDSRHTLKVAVEGKPLELLGGEGLEVPPNLERPRQ